MEKGAPKSKYLSHPIIDNPEKSHRDDGFAKNSRAKAGLCSQELRSEAYNQVRRNDEVMAQRHRWTFYETIKYCLTISSRIII